MKKSIFYFCVLLIFLLCGYFTVTLFSLSEKEIVKYQKIYFPAKSHNSPTHPVSQKRNNVQKDIFFTKNGQRFHFKIFSEKSEIQIINTKKAVENLENIICITQDKIFFDPNTKTPMQQLRYFTAKTGTYIYPTHNFTTDSINLSLFETPGMDLPDNINNLKPYMAGIAKEVSFSLIDKMPTFSAYHFKAAVDYDKAVSSFEKEIK